MTTIRSFPWTIGLLIVLLIHSNGQAKDHPAPSPADNGASSDQRIPMAEDADAWASEIPDSAHVKVEQVTDAKVEPVTERYPNGSIKVERHVTTDAQGNYVNHGSYKLYGLDGKVLKEGEFVAGKQQGKWAQTFAKDEGHLFSSERVLKFTFPPWPGVGTSD